MLNFKKVSMFMFAFILIGLGFSESAFAQKRSHQTKSICRGSSNGSVDVEYWLEPGTFKGDWHLKTKLSVASTNSRFSKITYTIEVEGKRYKFSFWGVEPGSVKRESRTISAGSSPNASLVSSDCD